MLNDLLYSYRKKRGLDYNGWITFVFKRWLRRNGLGFVVPFDMAMDWRNSSNVTLTIWEFGRRREEKIKFPDSMYASDIIYRLRNLGLTKSRNRYMVLLALGRRI